MSVAAAEPAAEAVGARTAAAGSKKAASTKWAHKQAATLASRGQSNAQITQALKDAGYDAATAKAAAGQSSTSSTPQSSTSSTPADPAADPTSTDPADPAPDRTAQAGADRAGYLAGKPGAKINGSGLLIGLVVYPVGMAFVRDGVPGIKAWFAAKFLNRVSAPTGTKLTPHVNPGTLPA